MRKLLLTVALATAAVFLGSSVASAEAHTLGKSRAAIAADNSLDAWATSGERDWEIVSEIDYVSPSDCYRINRHRVDCGVSYAYETIDGELYEDGTYYMDCVATAVVRYPSRWSYSPTVRFRDEECW